jgi:hypothetical protein
VKSFASFALCVLALIFRPGGGALQRTVFNRRFHALASRCDRTFSRALDVISTLKLPSIWKHPAGASVPPKSPLANAWGCLYKHAD